jgi:hypothetical protein
MRAIFTSSEVPERRLVRVAALALQDAGFAARRIPVIQGDVLIPIWGEPDLCAEVKVRADGFREIYGWVKGAPSARDQG